MRKSQEWDGSGQTGLPYCVLNQEQGWTEPIMGLRIASGQANTSISLDLWFGHRVLGACWAYGASAAHRPQRPFLRWPFDPQPGCGSAIPAQIGISGPDSRYPFHQSDRLLEILVPTSPALLQIVMLISPFTCLACRALRCTCRGDASDCKCHADPISPFVALRDLGRERAHRRTANRAHQKNSVVRVINTAQRQWSRLPGQHESCRPLFPQSSPPVHWCCR